MEQAVVRNQLNFDLLEIVIGDEIRVRKLCCENEAEQMRCLKFLRADGKQISIVDEEWWTVERSRSGGSVCRQAKRQVM